MELCVSITKTIELPARAPLVFHHCINASGMNIYTISNSYRDFKSTWVNNLDIWDIKEKKYFIPKATKFFVSGWLFHSACQYCQVALTNLSLNDPPLTARMDWCDLAALLTLCSVHLTTKPGKLMKQAGGWLFKWFVVAEMCFASLLHLGVTKKTPIHYCATVVVFLWKTSLEESFTLDIYALSNANNTSKLWAILPPHISSCLIPEVWTFFTFDLSVFLTVPWSWLVEILNVAQSLFQWQRKEQIPKWFCQYSMPSQIFSTVFSSHLCCFITFVLHL